MPGLTDDKSKELSDALNNAGQEVVCTKFSLTKAVHPTTGEIGYAAQLPLNAAGANLLIVQHQDSGIVQFVFPVQTSQPLLQGAPGAAPHNFAFILPMQFGLPTDIIKWVGLAALKIPMGLAPEAIWKIARDVEVLDKKEGFINLAKGYDQAATANDLGESKGKRVLLFVHGIFSSISGGFADLGDPGDPKFPMKTLVATYPGGVFGYNHWTISKTPLENALDLLDAIPAGANWDVDVVCHSRGGLVVRSLACVLKNGQNPATQYLTQITSKRQGKICNVGKAVFVAAANQGSPLADDDEIRNFLNVTAFLASVSGGFALGLVVGLVRTLVGAAFDLKSVQELATMSTLVSDLNVAGSLIDDNNVYGARADFDYNMSVFCNAGAVLDKLLMPEDNDLIVPYVGVASPDPEIPEDRICQFGSPGNKQGEVYHTVFFQQLRIYTFLTSICRNSSIEKVGGNRTQLNPKM